MKKAVLAIAAAAVLAGGVVVPSALGSSASTKHHPSKTGPAVTVQVKTTSKTLLDKLVHGKKGWITKGGTPKGKCSGASAAGALDAATHGRWTAKYYPGVKGGVFITSILGVTPKSPDYWGLYVNGKFSNKGACEVRLRAHERLLFKISK